MCSVRALCYQATVERLSEECVSQKTQLDAQCSELRRQITDLKETLVKESQTRETNSWTSLSRQLELVSFSLIPVVFSVEFIL